VEHTLLHANFCLSCSAVSDPGQDENEKVLSFSRTVAVHVAVPPLQYA